MSTYTAQRHADDEEAEHHQQNGLEVQQQPGLDYYGQGQQTNVATATQFSELANNPELAQLLQHEAAKQAAAMSMQYGMMGTPMMGLSGGVYRLPAEMMQMQPQIGVMEEEPLYVNAKQYNRILKRRATRAKLEAAIRASKAAGDKAPYMHESRHRHAMKRPRGPGGRFLTAAEIAELKRKEASEGKDTDSTSTGSSSAGNNEAGSKAKATKA